MPRLQSLVLGSNPVDQLEHPYLLWIEKLPSYKVKNVLEGSRERECVCVCVYVMVQREIRKSLSTFFYSSSSSPPSSSIMKLVAILLSLLFLSLSIVSAKKSESNVVDLTKDKDFNNQIGKDRPALVE